MNFNVRIKTLGYTTEQLVKLGFAVNIDNECALGERWAIGTCYSSLSSKIKRHKISTIGEIETIRN